MQKIQHYVLFPNHDNGMRLYGILKEAGIKTTIAPTPRVASKCCGISLLVREEDLDTIQKCSVRSHFGREWVKEAGRFQQQIAAIERDINPKRDKYC